MADTPVTTPTDPDEFRMEQWPFYWLTRFTGHYLQRIELTLKAIGLDVPRWRVLMSLRNRDVLSVSEIADHAIVKLPTMTKIIQRMQVDGLVVSQQSATDGRVTEVRLTQAGREAGEQAWKAANRIYRRAFENVEAGEIDMLNALLQRLSYNLSD
ncbi:MarR family winged helix-turn-helix transcriptional regulator [Novosphingobium sp.]|jgi:DNA-binding MarR family transcriptional regulator|uniref:MarR family winged helix-turn-helix transcriptional regulator n=1 Tax=Novosphingobium sp. TaxID=1874826 RepID=UPI0031DB6CDC